MRVDAGKTALKSDRRTGQTGDESMTLAGGNAEIPCADGPDDNSSHGRAQRDERVVVVAFEINHVLDGHGDFGIEERHDQNTEKIEDRRHNDRLVHTDTAGGNTGGNGVGGVGPSVYEDNAQCKEYRDQQYGMRTQLINKIGK